MKKFLFGIVLVILLFSRPHYVEGDRSWTVGMKLPIVTVSELPLCNAVTEESKYAVRDGDSSEDCVSGGGVAKALCRCDGTNWVPEASGGGGSSVPTLQDSYDTEVNPKIVSHGGGFTLEGFDSFANSFKLLDPITGQELRMGIDAAGAYFMTLKNGAPWITKLFSGFSWMLTLPNDSPIITADGTTGAVTVATSLEATGGGTIEANRTSCTGTNVLKFDGTCMSDHVRVVDTVDADVVIVSSVAETTIYSYSVPGGMLGTSACLRTTVVAESFDNAAGGSGYSIRLKYGGTSTGALSITPSDTASTRFGNLYFLVCNDAATNVQRLSWNGSLGSGANAHGGSAAIDSTTSQTLLISVQLAASDANYSFTMRKTKTELLP